MTLAHAGEFDSGNVGRLIPLRMTEQAFRPKYQDHAAEASLGNFHVRKKRGLEHIAVMCNALTSDCEKGHAAGANLGKIRRYEETRRAGQSNHVQGVDQCILEVQAAGSSLGNLRSDE